MERDRLTAECDNELWKVLNRGVMRLGGNSGRPKSIRQIIGPVSYSISKGPAVSERQQILAQAQSVLLAILFALECERNAVYEQKGTSERGPGSLEGLVRSKTSGGMLAIERNSVVCAQLIVVRQERTSESGRRVSDSRPTPQWQE